MKKTLYAIAFLAVLLMGGCAAPSDPNGHGVWGFSVHNRGWSAIHDPAEGVMKLSTTRDFFMVSPLGTINGEWLGPIRDTGPSQVNAGYNLRTCLYSVGANYNAPNQGNNMQGQLQLAGMFLYPQGVPNARAKMLNAWENRMEPCMHLQGFYNDLASGVGGYCTADGQPTQKFVDKAQEFLQEHGSLSAFAPVKVGDVWIPIAKTEKFSIPWQDSTPQGFAKIACADAAMSARAGGFWNVGCQAYTRSSNDVAYVNSDPKDFRCAYSTWNVYAGTDSGYGTFGALGDWLGSSYGQYETWVSMGPMYRWFLGLPTSQSMSSAQAKAARAYLTGVWNRVEAAHPYTGPAGQIKLDDYFASSETKFNDAQTTCRAIIQQERAYGKGKYLVLGGNYKCMLDQGWHQ